jgi:hypothetical protein
MKDTLCIISVTLLIAACSEGRTEIDSSPDESGLPTLVDTPSADTDVRATTFHDYSCTDDCSGHEAGYQWAGENGIDNPDDCGGNSQSFEEGCRAFAEEEGLPAHRRNSSSVRVGDNTFYSDGTSATRIGDSTFYSDGTSATSIGDSTFYSDGTSATRIGNSTFNSDGTTATQVGNSTFHSDGTTCQTVGSSTFCN